MRSLLGGKGAGLPEVVRPGAAFSMPGMMDTILNLGLTSKGVDALAAKTGNRRWALDSRRRLVSMFGRIVKGIPAATFDGILHRHREQAGAARDGDLPEAALEGVVAESLARYGGGRGGGVPPGPPERTRPADGGAGRPR